MAKLARRFRPSSFVTSKNKQDVHKDTIKKARRSPIRLKRVTLLLLFVTLVLFLSFAYTFKGTWRSSEEVTGPLITLSPEIQISINFDDLFSYDPIQPVPVRVSLIDSCSVRGLWLRIEGDALLVVNLSESKDNSWSGKFVLPMEGSYSMFLYWCGCEESEKRNPSIQRLSVLNHFQARKKLSFDESKKSSVHQSPTLSKWDIYPHAAWLSKKFFPHGGNHQPYIWHNPSIPASNATLLEGENVLISKEGAIGEFGFFDFKALSNYELVCWIGTDSAKALRQRFLEIRPMIAKRQRPFKFHMYPIDYFNEPDRNWEGELKNKFRKCKHILVSLDEVKNAHSQRDFAKQITIFINHLLKAFPDETFPIWMFTVYESPTYPTNCWKDLFLPRTSDHPCNTVLKKLFQEQSIFPPRVRLLDSTDISLPQFDGKKEEISAAIALRIFVFVGKQVQHWREADQEGTINGLKRGGKTEPNFKLTPYTGWR